jgi:hypothetical protein
VIGKAFWDIGHAPKDQSNRIQNLPGCSAWEIHAVMKLTVPVIRVYDEVGNVIETHEHAGDFKEW